MLALVSCVNDDVIQEQPYFELSENSLLFNSIGGSQNVCVRSNVDWNISGQLPQWISISNHSDSIVSFCVNANEGVERECEVAFNSKLGQEILKVKQNSMAKLLFVDKRLELNYEKSRLNLIVNTNISYKLKIEVDGTSWLSYYSKLGNIFISEIESQVFDSKILTFDVEENDTPQERKARLIVYNEDYQLSDTLNVIQKKCEVERYLDGENLLIHKAKRGCVNLVLMGDGFVRKHLLHGGEYEKSINKAMEHFFSIEPFKSFQDYFNVYMVVAESQEEGVGKKGNIEKTVDNRFGTAFGDGTEIVGNNELIFEYARKVKEIPNDKPITVLVVLNSTKYAGTAYLYPEGNSIALCPMSTEESPNDFEGIVHHEAGGHAFGFLLDEYVYNQRKMPDERKRMIREWQEMGYHLNLDFTDDLDKILWKDFIGIDKYAPVGAYEGGYEYQYGVWRSEENSCMNNNIPYYNVQSRWAIVKRIMDLSEIEFSLQDFIKNDFPEYPTDSRALNTWEKFVPLGNPVWVIK